MVRAFLLAILAASIAVAAQTAPPTAITYLPFVINAPGKYVLASSLGPSPGPGNIAITIFATTSGPITLDLNGFTLSGAGGYRSDEAIQITGNGSNNAPITIKNGTLLGFAGGIGVGNASNITIKNLVLSGFVSGIGFGDVFNSSIKDCQFTVGNDFADGVVIGNSSEGSVFNNSGKDVFNNLTFDGIAQPFVIENDFNALPLFPRVLVSCIPGDSLAANTVEVTVANAPPVKVNTLPLVITNPGTYTLTKSLSGDVTVYAPIAGPVILNLNGFIITGGITIQGNGAANNFPLVVRNGTVNSISAHIHSPSFPFSPISGLQIKNMIFNVSNTSSTTQGTGLSFIGVTNSTVTDCTFTALNGFGYRGVLDDSDNSNVYKNLTFKNLFIPFLDWAFSSSSLNTAEFATPTVGTQPLSANQKTFKWNPSLRRWKFEN